MILLENETDLLIAQRSPLLSFQMVNGGVMEKIFSHPAVIMHSENVKQGGFPSAGRTHHRNKLPLGDFDVDVAEDVKKFSLRQRIRAFEVVKSDHLGVVAERDHRIGASCAKSGNVAGEQSNRRQGN